jgi:hypothetical protein
MQVQADCLHADAVGGLERSCEEGLSVGVWQKVPNRRLNLYAKLLRYELKF